MLSDARITLFVIFGVYCFLLVFLNLRRERFVSNRVLSLFRVLFPSWRFFSDVVCMPRLSCRIREQGGEFSPWIPCAPMLERRWSAFVLNPSGNLAHAMNSLLHQLEQDIEEWDDAPERFPETVSYELTKLLVLEFLQGAQGVDARREGTEYQFKISSVQPAIQQSVVEQPADVILVSPVHQV